MSPKRVDVVRMIAAVESADMKMMESLMSKKYFGTDGIRGRVGEFPITPDFMLKLGWAAGMAFRSMGACRILVGKDTRISGLHVRVRAGGWSVRRRC